MDYGLRPNGDFTPGKIWLIGPAGPTGRGVRIVVKSTDITLSRHSEEGLSIRNALSGTMTDIEMEDDGAPFAGFSVALDGHGQLFALAMRKAVDELRLGPGEQVFALIKTVALDERAVAQIEP